LTEERKTWISWMSNYQQEFFFFKVNYSFNGTV